MGLPLLLLVISFTRGQDNFEYTLINTSNRTTVCRWIEAAKDLSTYIGNAKKYDPNYFFAVEVNALERFMNGIMVKPCSELSEEKIFELIGLEVNANIDMEGAHISQATEILSIDYCTYKLVVWSLAWLFFKPQLEVLFELFQRFISF